MVDKYIVTGRYLARKGSHMGGTAGLMLLLVIIMLMLGFVRLVVVKLLGVVIRL